MTAVDTPEAVLRGEPVVSVTGRALRRRLVRLTVLTGVVLVTSAVMLAGANDTARDMRAEATRAAQGVAGARLALLEAHTEAIGALNGPAVALTGPGEEYLGNLTLASQSLEQVAEVNGAGAQGSQSLQLLGSMISTYSGLVEKANAAYAGGDDLLGDAQVWYASDFLYGSILAEFGTLDELQRDALTAHDESFWTEGWTVLFWLVPAVLLLAVLVETQAYLRRRFRRRLNPELAVATLLVLAAVVVAPVLAVRADAGLSDATADLLEVRDLQGDLSANAAAAGRRDLYELLGDHCTAGENTCLSPESGLNANEKFDFATPATQAQAQAVEATATTTADRAAGHFDRAAGLGLGLLIALAVGAVVVFLLVPAGLRPRLSEYEYAA